MAMIQDQRELSEETRCLRSPHRSLMLQEYIPGSKKCTFRLLLDQGGRAKVALALSSIRDFPRLSLTLPTARRMIVGDPYTVSAIDFVRQLGLWGAATVETKVDPRDGLPKLMEVNPRLGHHLWYLTEQDINEPLLCLQIARGKQVEVIESLDMNTALIDPIEDILGLGFRLLDGVTYALRVRLQGKAPYDMRNQPQTPRQVLHSYHETSRKRMRKHRSRSSRVLT